jgi:soluble lytic murein transglycosylase-like protein
VIATARRQALEHAARLGACLALGLIVLSGCAHEAAYRPAPLLLPPVPPAGVPTRIPPLVPPANGLLPGPPLIGPAVPPWANDGASYASTVQWAADYYQLPVTLLWAVIKVESNFDSDARSGAGAQGLMQLMPGTASDLGVRDPYDPYQNIFAGARYLRLLANRFAGDLQYTLAGYNAGPYAVQRAGGVPPYPETIEYVRKVLGYYFGSVPERVATSEH